MHRQEHEGRDESAARRDSKLLDILLAAQALGNLRDDESSASSLRATSKSNSFMTVESALKGDEPQQDSQAPPNKEGVESKTGNTFPEKLMHMLSHDDVRDSIMWLPGGKSFVIANQRKFTAEVLPRFFKQCKFDSFVRKLYRWVGTDKGTKAVLFVCFMCKTASQ